MAQKNQDKERLRLLADRLCYLERGTDGLRWRHGMLRADRNHRDKWDMLAERMVNNGQK